MVLGSGWSAFAWSLDPLFFLWSLPVAIPLILAAPTAVCLSRSGPGEFLRVRGLLSIPEEREPPLPLLEDARRYRYQEADEHRLTPFEQAVLVPRLNQLHRVLSRDLRRGPRRAELQTVVARCLKRGPNDLTRSELSFIARDGQSLKEMHAGAWRSKDDSYWGECIRRKNREKIPH